MKRSLLGTAIVLALLAAPRLATAADPSAEDVDRARTYFDAGAQAYAAERYADAVRSFELAEKLVPKPSILFSLAQAERKLYAKTNDVATGRAALAHYREYLEKVPKGGRSADAREARDELEARLKDSGSPPSAVASPPEKRRARVTVISATPGARGSYDGGEPQDLPMFVDLEPGRHVVRLFGDGFFDYEQVVTGDKPVDIAINEPLRERPSRLIVALGERGELYLDGRLLASTPVGGPVEVPPGTHVVSVSVNGKRAWSQEIAFTRDRELRIEPRLERSDQRTAAWTLLGSGGVVTVVGVLSGLGALGEESLAKDLEDAQLARNLTSDERDRHNTAIDRRDVLRTTSVVTLSVGGVMLAAGALLYAFDRPTVAVLPPRPQEKPRPRAPSLELSASPVVSPGTWGGAVVGRF